MAAKSKELVVLRILAVCFINVSAGTAMHILGGILQGSHGAPSFLSPGFIAYGILSSFLLVGAYCLLGYRIPVRSRVLKGLIFILLFWASNYISQILGMSGAESAILDSSAFSVSTIILDTAAYFITGVFMGLLLDFGRENSNKECAVKDLLKACIASMIIFPSIVLVMELTAGKINRGLLSYIAFGISEQDIIPYYTVFYLCQAFSGFLFPVFYRLTEYNSSHEKKWLWFAAVYGLMLWAPVVLIVIFFGTPVLPTIVFTIILETGIYLDCMLFGRILGRR